MVAFRGASDLQLMTPVTTSVAASAAAANKPAANQAE
jgi:hypothetical protein